jgi:hypothetical protein
MGSMDDQRTDQGGGSGDINPLPVLIAVVLVCLAVLVVTILWVVYSSAEA